MASELALLVLFVYIPIVLGSMYIAWLAVGRQRVREASHAALYPREDEVAAGTGELAESYKQEAEEAYFREFHGDPEIEGRYADDRDVPMSGELRKMFEKFTEPMYHPSSVTARGSFALQGGRVVYRETIIRTPERWTIRPEGQVVNSLRLLDDEIPENLTELLQEYMRRRMAFASYHQTLRPGNSGNPNGHDVVVRGDEKDDAWSLRVPNEEAGRLEGWRPESAVRWTKQRMVGDQSPPGSDQRSWIGTPPAFETPETSEDFWNPN
jgi:hypothetical protein